jgi:hypothetical protein
MRKQLIAWACLLAVVGLSPFVSATVLMFSNADGTVVGATGPIPQDYGDNAVPPIQGGYAYGVDHGKTVNTTVDYAVGASGDIWLGWNEGYGDLGNCAYPWLDSSKPLGYGDLQMTFTVANGVQVVLYSFDLAGYGGSSYPLHWDVRDSVGGTVLASGDLTGLAVPHTRVTLDPAVTSTVNGQLVLTVYTSHLGPSAINVAISKIVFGEDPEGGVVAVCGDAIHPKPLYDFTGDCYVDIQDFVIFISHWLDCTIPVGGCNYTAPPSP